MTETQKDDYENKQQLENRKQKEEGGKDRRRIPQTIKLTDEGGGDRVRLNFFEEFESSEVPFRLLDSESPSARKPNPSCGQTINISPLL